MQASPAVIFARFRGFHVQQLHRVFAVRSPLKRLRNRDRMCNRITAHARRYDYHLVRASPRHPASVRKCSMWLPVLFRFLVDLLATLGHRLVASGITSRMLSVIPVLFFGDESPDSPQTRSKALRRTKRVLDARQGMEGAKNAYRGSQEVKRADTPNQGLSGRQEPRQPPAKPICTEQAAMRLVGGRRPSVLQRWGSGVLPRRFPVALKALPEPWRLGFFWRTGSKNTQRILRRQRAM